MLKALKRVFEPTSKIQKRIGSLKRQAGAYYLQYMEDSEDLNCGKQMAETLRPHLTILAKNFNEIMSLLEKLDPENCPKGKRL